MPIFNRTLLNSVVSGCHRLLCVCICVLICFSFVQFFVTLLKPTMLLCLCNSSGKNAKVICQFLLQGIFPTQGSSRISLCLLHWQAGFFCLFVCLFYYLHHHIPQLILSFVRKVSKFVILVSHFQTTNRYSINIL